MEFRSLFHRSGLGDRKVVVIAEAGINHNGELGLAKELVDFAAWAGADAVKFQTFQADLVASETAPKAEYQRLHTSRKESHREMIRRCELSEKMHRILSERCNRRGITFLSTPFDAPSADLLERIGVSVFKIPSGELTNLPFLAHVAKKGKPLIMSTGMATLKEVTTAVRTVRRSGNTKLVLLHCVSAYPAEPKDMNLRAMETLHRCFNVPVGLSDHTIGSAVAIAAVALGATVIEKHITVGRSLKGPDHSFSLMPDEFKRLVADIRSVEAARGDGRKKPVRAETRIASISRRSLFVARPLLRGERLDRSAVAILRPGTGLGPEVLPSLLGRRLVRSVASGRMLTREMLQ